MAAEHTALIGAHIRQARESAGLTQRELAEALPGKSDGTQVSKWERGINRPSDDTLEHIARVTNRSVAWFHTREPDKSTTPDVLEALDNNGVATVLGVLTERLGKLDDEIAALRIETEARDLEVLRLLGAEQPPSSGSQPPPPP